MEDFIKLLLFISGIVLIFIAGDAYSQRRVTQMIGLSGFCIAGALYSMGYAIELGTITLDQFYFVIKIEYLGICALPIFIVILILEVIDRRDLINPFMIIGVMALPVLTYALVFTAPLHHLYYTSIALNSMSGLTIAELEKGFWYYPFVIYINCLLLGNLVFLGYMIIHSKEVLQRQYRFLFFALLVPVMGSTSYYFGFSPYGMDPTPFSLIGTSAILIYALNQELLISIASRLREKIFNNTPVMILILNKHQEIIDYNVKIINVFQIKTHQILGKSVREVFKDHPALVEFITEPINDDKRLENRELLKNLKHHCNEYRLTDIGNKKIHLQLATDTYFKVQRSLIDNSRGKVIGQYIVIDDITHEALILNKLDHMAKHDTLTGIMNRASFYSVSRTYIERQPFGEWCSLLMIDIDHFKKVNDQYGHLAGDDVLKGVCKIFSEHIRETDIVGRFGGEEFVLFMAGAGIEVSQRLAERLRELVENTQFMYNGNAISITISIGVATASKDETLKLEKLLDIADQTMYLAKKNGRNRVEVILMCTPL